VRATRAEVDLGAIGHNVALLAEHVAPAELCAVVKADGYGHGAISVGRAALAAGATWLAVALVEEAAVLRRNGVDAPILLLSEPRPTDLAAAVRLGIRTAVYTERGIDEAASAAAAVDEVARVHLKVDTGMHRVGADPSAIVALAQRIRTTPGVELEALWTHCAVADEPDNPFTATQLARLDATLAALADLGLAPPLVHAANSAAAMDHPAARHDLVRAGIAIYGIDPSPALHGRLPLRPAMSLVSEVSLVKPVRAGEGISYGQRHVFATDTVVAVVPVGYADGVPRALSGTGAEVLIGGRRRPVVGVITMDHLMVDCGTAGDVAAGDEVVLLGSQGDERIDAADWAEATGTIAYEVVCGIGPRVPRIYRR
jgi:alanine racemase